MQIKEFYSLNPPSLSPISNPQWRQFRFFLSSKRFFKVPDTIRNPKTLQKWLLAKQPLDVYYSVSCFLNPEKIGPKTKIISENLFLHADLVFDIDKAPFSIRNIETAKKETLKLIAFLKSKGIEIKYIAFSGSKGFHVVCSDPFSYSEENPLKREEKAKQFRKQLAEEILGLGIKIDSKVTVDTRRILRLPGTINSKTGLECIVLSEEDLQLRATQILKKPGSIDITASRIRRGDDLSISCLSKILGLNRLEARSNPSFHYASFLSSSVTGTKLNVPIISFHTTNEKKAVDKILFLQKTYRLGDFFLFRGEKLFALCLDALQKKRIEKILQSADSSNLNFFKKYGKTFIGISPKINEKNSAVEDAPVFLKKIESQFSSKPVSKAHLEFLRQCEIKTKSCPLKCGKEEFALSHCLVEN